jgi:hypothetical protein
MVDIPDISFPDFNYTNFTGSLINNSMQGYVNIMGIFLYPFLFSIIIICTYLYFRSAVLAVSVTLIIVVVFGNTWVGVGTWVTFLHIAISLTVSMLLLLFLIKKRG